MKKFHAMLLASASALLVPALAVAADMPVRGPVYTKAPVDVPLWNGVYIGIHGGYGWGDADSSVGATVGTGSPDGAFGGFQFGYNYHVNRNWVLGYEVDVSFGDVSSALAPFAPSEIDVSLFGTARARLGYAQGPWLFYVTGGLAWAKPDTNIAGVVINDRAHVGWTAGLGAEYALSRNWSAKIEYLYADFDGTRRTIGATAVNSDLTMSMVRLGLNYRFSNFGAVAQAPAFPTKAPVRVAATWTGAYVGVHGGYGWGSFDTTVAGIATSLEPTGGFGGIQSGYNWQFSRNWVIGVEGDSSWGSIKDTIGATNIDIDSMGTVRARLGYAVDRTLFYGTGGLAWAHVNSSAAGPVTSDHYLLGWTIGAGVEWQFSPQWTAKLEYSYADYGATETVGVAGVRDDLSVHAIKVGLNYRASLFGLLLNQ